ncbi:tetraacyldisaccharide 4'-kinase [Chlorobaculum sp. MV4-Y]|uniref:tetraacyldisaccharide 4'-kinase n=1 Tax=Chlorobaculum sp. MV4-Y TaxID=2976335 RepID=UPI0021B073C9|nr:tetraacyldisaccharide 4'-kinase [Chlorobaculum sp. MV4-Y]UWX58096.1 tetraacyldisaccharide 4'-kinase [Chlorobaculum sp. MV4-Y]
MSSATLLRPAAALYGMVMSLRNRLYDRGIFKSWRSPIPVVSVGNITTGGTGKTPLVDWIVKFYAASGIATAIVSRGYGRRTKGVQLVSDGRHILLGSRDAGDETAMLAARNPGAIVVVAENRAEGVQFLMRQFAGRLPGVIVLDDAFQHRKIARDLDIVVVNASAPQELDAMLPAGRLREPLRGLDRADLVILGKITDETQANKLLARLKQFGKPVLRSRIKPGPLIKVDGTQSGAIEHGKKALAFAGIGAPAGFLHSLEAAGVKVTATKFFRDHKPYTETAIRSIIGEAKRQSLVPVTTEKDWFRIEDEPELAELLAEAGCCYLPIEQEFIDSTAELERRLMGVVKR